MRTFYGLTIENIFEFIQILERKLRSDDVCKRILQQRQDNDVSKCFNKTYTL